DFEVLTLAYPPAPYTPRVRSYTHFLPLCHNWSLQNNWSNMNQSRHFLSPYPSDPCQMKTPGAHPKGWPGTPASGRLSPASWPVCFLPWRSEVIGNLPPLFHHAVPDSHS